MLEGWGIQCSWFLHTPKMFRMYCSHLGVVGWYAWWNIKPVKKYAGNSLTPMHSKDGVNQYYHRQQHWYTQRSERFSFQHLLLVSYFLLRRGACRGRRVVSGSVRTMTEVGDWIFWGTYTLKFRSSRYSYGHSHETEEPGVLSQLYIFYLSYMRVL